MSALRVQRDGDDWLVWIGLEGDGDISREGLGFVIGVGKTRDAAVAEAVADLEAVVARLQEAPPESADE